jgi:rod shape determining protein RodA
MNRTYSSTRGVDFISVLLYMALVLLGFFTIYSASHTGETFEFTLQTKYGKQLLWIVVSLVIAFVVLLTESRFFEVFSFYIFGGCLVLLAIVLVVGVEVNGAKSWIQLGGFRLQPAEFTKFGVSLALAKYLSNMDANLGKRRSQLITSTIIFIPVFFIILQGDAGSSLVYFSLILVLYREGLTGLFLVIGLVAVALFVASIAWGWTIVAGILGVICLVGVAFNYTNKRLTRNIILISMVCAVYSFGVRTAFENVLQKHQKTRIEVMLGLKEDRKGVGYNVDQSKIAIGSGGFSGKGFLNGTQTKGDFVPEQHTDFIFTIVGEEFGWIGTTLVILLFVGFLLRIIHLAERQRTIFKRVYAYCVFSIFLFHMTINIAMTINLAPVIGIPLPFFSYGGSSLMTFTALLFVLLKMDAERENDLESLY